MKPLTAQPIAPGLNPTLHALKNYQVVGEFHVNTDHFFVLFFEHYLNQSSLEVVDFLNSDLVQTTFEKNGSFYAIVEAQSWLDSSQASSEAISRSDSSEHIHQLMTRLTERELQIAVLIAQGWSNKQVAAHLKISEWTVATHLRRIFMKLNVDSRAAMVYQCAPLIRQTVGDVP